MVCLNFGPSFLKFCSYISLDGSLRINGHEYLKASLKVAWRLRRYVAYV